MLSTIEKLFDAPEKLKTMCDAMRALANPNAAATLSSSCRNLQFRNSPFAGAQV